MRLTLMLEYAKMDFCVVIAPSTVLGKSNINADTQLWVG